MASRVDDRWLWFGVGILAFVAAKGIQYAMTDIVRLTELDVDQYPSQMDCTRQPEDSLSIHTLRTLVKSTNPAIATAAQDLIVKRFAALPDATEILTNDLSSGDEARRQRARQAMQFLHEWGMDFSSSRNAFDELDFDGSSNQLPSSNYLPSSNQLPIMDRSEWDMIAEDSRDADDDAEGPWSSGIVARLEELEELSRGDVTDISAQPRFAGWGTFPHSRTSNDGNEEVERRRRRREAMVLHEGEGGIVEGDIIRPRGR